MANYYHIKIRRATAANWASDNPTPADGEICWETDTKKIKVGDGVTAYNALAYFTLPNATTTAAGLMSAADKSKLNGINISLYAPLNSPSFSGSPQAPNIAGRVVSKVLANANYVESAIARTNPYMVRCEYYVSSGGLYQIASDLSKCTYMAVNNEPVGVDVNKKLEAGFNYIDYLFFDKDFIAYNSIPDDAFSSIADLKRVLLPVNLFRIGNKAFIDSGLEEVWCLSPTPATIGADTFTNTTFAAGGKCFCHKDNQTTYAGAWGFGCVFLDIA